MKRTLLFPLLTILALAGPTRAQDVAYEKFTLDNGLTVIFHEDHSLPVACVDIWYGVGAKDQPDGRSGFAHLFEHLMFMGTERVPGDEFDAIVEAEGGWSNASTSPDRTNYFLYGPNRLLPTLLWLDADRMEDLGRAMTEEKLNAQRDIVRNERRQGIEMEPYGEAEFAVNTLMFPPGHPYHYDVIGRHEDLEAATLQDVKDFFAAYYTPNNASLVVAGDFDPAEVRPLVERLFGSIPRGPEPPRPEAMPARLEEERRIALTDDVQAGRLYLIYHSPASMGPGDAEMDLAANVLGSGKSSRLYKRLVYDERLATDVSVFQMSMRLGSLFTIIVSAGEGVSLDSIERVADEEIARFVSEGPGAEELERHKTSWERYMLHGLQSVLEKADQLNRYQFTWEEPNSFRRDLDRYRNADAAAVRRWAKEVLHSGGRLVMRVSPESEGPLRASRDERPGPLPDRPFRLEEPDVFTLANGIEVRHWRRSELPLVDVSFLVHAGSARLDVERPGAARLVADMLDEGAGALDALAFSDSLERLGASLYPSAGREDAAVRVSALRRNLDGAVGLLADAVIRPRFDERDWERVRRLRVEELQQAEDRPGDVARVVAMRAFFGDGHPYGRPIDGTVEDLGSLTLDQARKLHERFYGPGNASLFIAGDLTKEEARDLLGKAFGSWKGGASFEKVAPSAPLEPENRSLRLVVVDVPGAVQTVIRFVMPGPLAADPDRVRYDLLNGVLGGSFTSRLNQNLREKRGFTYGAGSSFNRSLSAGYLWASSDVQADSTGAAVAEFLAEFNRIRTGDITEDEARKARETLRMETVQGFEGLGGLLRAAETCAAYGLPFSSIGEDLRTMASVSAADLNALAPRAIPTERALLFLLGDRSLIEKQLEGMGLPKPEERDKKGNLVSAGAR